MNESRVLYSEVCIRVGPVVRGKELMSNVCYNEMCVRVCITLRCVLECVLH